ncbi:MAG: Rpn family recombination-promoting nuclease/putative transposase [Bacteroidales bacterium]|jgi:predicted transposase/invertase (TIGR01784 family)|nr:Rpn family recombination-promoting nuclease/putative transposase [Bacteroidales bacterium]
MTSLTEKYINPFTDFGFKKLFGSEVNKDILLDFLNELIKDQGKITDIQYLKNEQLRRSEWDRKAIFDIYCQNERGEKFIVEMQRAKQKYFKDRSVYYSSFPIQEQAKAGDWDFELKAVYLVGILDFVFEEDKNDSDPFSQIEVQLMDIKRKKVFYDKLTFIYLELPKFNKKEEELESHFDKWMYVLKNLPLLAARPARLQERVFERLFATAEILKFSKAEIIDYEDSLKVYRDLKNTMDYAIEFSAVENFAKGEAKGLAEGMEKGIEKRNAEITQNLNKKGFSISEIAEFTGLSKNKISEILNHNK